MQINANINSNRKKTMKERKKEKLCKLNWFQKQYIIEVSNQSLFGTICIHLSFVSFIWNHLQKYFLQFEHHIELLTGSLVKPSIWEVTLSKKVPSWAPVSLLAWHSFFLFHSDGNMWSHFLYFHTQMLQ